MFNSFGLDQEKFELALEKIRSELPYLSSRELAKRLLSLTKEADPDVYYFKDRS